MHRSRVALAMGLAAVVLPACGSAAAPSSPTPSAVSAAPTPPAPVVAAGAQFQISGPITVTGQQSGCSVGSSDNNGAVDVEMAVSGGSGTVYTVQLDIIQASDPAPNQPLAIHAISNGVYRPSVMIVKDVPEYFVSRGTVTIKDADATAGTITGTQFVDPITFAPVAGQLSMSWQGCSHT